MKITQITAFAATALSLTFIHGYKFDTVREKSTSSADAKDLSQNEASHIFNGDEANIKEVPFLAGIREPFMDVTICGGTLISPRYILTAGHCTLKFDNLVATFGTNLSIGTDGSPSVEKIRIVEQFRHPCFVRKKHLFDVGLVKLERPATRRPARLCARNGSDNMVGTMATAYGWGKTENAELSQTLRKITLPIVSRAECGKYPKYVGRVTRGMLCAGTGHGRDTCNGDSGGPLLVDGDILIGCVSWGSKCGEQPAIFTRLTYVMDYIEDILAGNNGSNFICSSRSEQPYYKASGANGGHSLDSASSELSMDEMMQMLDGSLSDEQLMSMVNKIGSDPNLDHLVSLAGSTSSNNGLKGTDTGKSTKEDMPGYKTSVENGP